MNLFPDIYPTVWEPDFEAYQERDTSRAGGLQINSYDPVLQFFARGSWEVLSRTNYDLIEDHWWANRTSAFSLFNFHARKLRDLFVAVADGVQTVYTLPAKAVVSPAIEHNGVLAGFQPSLLVGTGSEGRDQIQYTAGTKPANGVVITLDAADGRQWFEEVYYEIARFPSRHREAEIWMVEASFRQKVVA